MKREEFPSGAPWESIVGYSRAVRAGNQLFVSGTTAVNEEGKVHGNAAMQMQACIEKIKAVLEKAGGNLTHVVRTRMFVTNIDDWEAIGRVHGEYFGDIRPASTMVEVSRLIAPEILVEIEVDAILPES
ncbi:MAG: RidA family protein [Gammaproteobacteria bacterium]